MDKAIKSLTLNELHYSAMIHRMDIRAMLDQGKSLPNVLVSHYNTFVGEIKLRESEEQKNGLRQD